MDFECWFDGSISLQSKPRKITMGEEEPAIANAFQWKHELDAPFETIGILSMGEMGAAIAALLTTNDYRVVTYTGDRR